MKAHWENIYKTKKLEEVSWYQKKPETSLEFILALKLAKNARILDMGGGDSFLADFLLEEGYTNITVADISEKALERARERLGKNAEKIKWVVTDASEFIPSEEFDLWHDRAAFHFLTEKVQINNYLKILKKAVKPGGFVILGTFSEKGPTKCSGIVIKQYSIEEMQSVMGKSFTTIKCENRDHTTPSGGTQNFTFCSFQKKNN